jgi:solute carrier family 12 (potassium/chloride transporter), member 4/6
MQAEVIVVTMKSWESHMENSGTGAQQDGSHESYTSAQQRIRTYLAEMKETAERERHPLMENGRQVVVNEQKIDKFLYTMLRLNSTILRYSRMAAVVLVSLPPRPLNYPSYFYM